MLAAAVLATAGCSQTLAGRGTLAEGAPTRTPPATPTPTATATPTPTPTKSRNPATVARAVDVRPSDLPAGWTEVAGSRGGFDTLSWLIVCARDAQVGPGSLSGAESPDFSVTGTNKSSQVGSVTGLFADDSAASRYVALLRDPAVGRCVAAEAVRTEGDSFSSVPAFRSGPLRAPGASETAGLGSVATGVDGRGYTIQFYAIRTGPIVTMLDTFWVGGADNRLLASVAAKIAARQRTV